MLQWLVLVLRQLARPRVDRAGRDGEGARRGGAGARVVALRVGAEEGEDLLWWGRGEEEADVAFEMLLWASECQLFAEADDGAAMIQKGWKLGPEGGS